MMPETGAESNFMHIREDARSPGIAWRPSASYIHRSHLRRFMQRHSIASFGELLDRSTSDTAWFWDAVVDDLGLEWFTPYSQVLDLSRGIEWPRWVRGGRYNHVHDAVDKRALATPGATAILWEGEDGEVRSLTCAELNEQVCRAANAFASLGVGKGDRVGVFMPMIPETAVTILAVAKLGAIYVPVFSGFGGHAVASRLTDCEARVLVTADGFYRGGKTVPMKVVADEAVSISPTVEHVLVVRRLGQPMPWTAERDLWWHELLDAQRETRATEPADPEDPYIVIYTSGTTGIPKGVVHVHGGFPIKAAQELAHCFDLHEGERFFWISDIGWMMGPWAITGSLMLGATCVMYEGAIAHPRPDRVWDLVARHRITHLGISPTAVRSLMRHGDHLPRSHDLSSLVVLAGAGEPWNPDPWRWLFEVAGGGTRPIINYSGGTEVSGGILSCNTLLPIVSCAFSAPVPGMAADVVDASGNSMRGEVGELALRQPWPGIARGFWNDSDRYLDTYWSRVPGLWVHGDWARVDENGAWYILGRSDDTIKVAGKRVGPAEVESAAVSHPAVAEAAAIGAPDELKGEAIVLFVVPHPGHTETGTDTERLRAEIEASITSHLGKSLKPGAIIFVPDLPRTRNGKILRRLVRRQYLGEPLGDLSSLENPSALDEIATLRSG